MQSRRSSRTWKQVRHYAALLLCLWSVAAQAAVDVFVQNNTTLGYTVEGTGGPGLSSNESSQVVEVIPPGAGATILRLDPHPHIGPLGRAVQFVRRLEGGGGALYLEQRLDNTGTRTTLRGAGFTRSATWRLPNRTVYVKHRIRPAGIEYVLQDELPRINLGGPGTLNVLSYNIYMRPTGTIFHNGQQVRKSLLIPWLKGYDVVILQEAFDDEIRQYLIDELGADDEYPFHTRVVGADSWLHQDGGVIILSRWPIEYEDQEVFDDCAGTDCRARKGVVYARINKKGRRYHLFGTHLEAGSADVRERQLSEMQTFIDSFLIPQPEAVIIGGDFNTARSIGHRFNQVTNILNVTQPPLAGPLQHSIDGTINDLTNSKRRLIDYIFWKEDHKRPWRWFNMVLLPRSAEPWREYFLESDRWDLSDHFPVYARFEFDRRVAAGGEVYATAPVRPSDGSLISPQMGAQEATPQSAQMPRRAEERHRQRRGLVREPRRRDDAHVLRRQPSIRAGLRRRDPLR